MRHLRQDWAFGHADILSYRSRLKMLSCRFMLTLLAKTLTQWAFPPICQICAQQPAEDPTDNLCNPCLRNMPWIAPPFCQQCGRHQDTSGTSCGDCRHERYHYDRAGALAWYDGHMKRLLRLYKFHDGKGLSHFLTAHLHRYIQNYLSDETWDAVLAVPMDKAKQRMRGYNQSALLARSLAHALDLPDLTDQIHRRLSSAPLYMLGKYDRRRQLQWAFECSNAPAFADKQILLLDDILTTGSTASECARVLKKAGARRVTVLSCARGK